MEYVQTVLFQIPAARADEPEVEALFEDLDAHRSFLRSQPGFTGIEITRSLNPEGNVLVVVETRWRDNNSLAGYSSREPNVVSVVQSHGDIAMPGSLQVHRMQSVGTDPPVATTRIYDRLALALLVPVGVLAFALLVIYGLSRIYLEIPKDVATPMAAAIALAILGLAWYFATHPRVPRWQIAGIVGVFVALLAGFGSYAAVRQNDVEAKPEASSGPSTPQGPSGGPEIDMGDNFFTVGGQRNGALTVKPGDTVNIVNSGTALHNVHVADPGGSYTGSVCTAGGPEPCSTPRQVPGGTRATLAVSFSGTRTFRCDFHPDQMTGSITVQ